MWHLHCIASAEDEDILKFYMYGKHNNDQYVCLEVQMDKANKILTMGTKANHSVLVEATARYIL